MRIMRVIFIFAYFLIPKEILGVTSSFKITEGPNAPPRVGISSWMTVEQSRDGGRRQWEYGLLTPLLKAKVIGVERSRDGTTLSISSHLDKIRVVCNASYPVRWFTPTPSPFRPDGVYNFAFYIYDARVVTGNVRDSKSFLYQSILEVDDSSGGISRNFYCQSLSNPTIKRSLYIYWEGTNFLTYAGELIDVRTLDNQTIVLPCTVTRPDVFVYLLKETAQGEMEIGRNDSITYAPNIGFTLNLKQLSDPFGRYRCISEDIEEYIENEEKSVRLNVLRGIYVKPARMPIGGFNETILNNASFTFDGSTGRFICCSSSSRAPNLKVVYCPDPLTCETKQEFLNKVSSGSRKRIPTNDSCSYYTVYRRNSGILRCRGDDIDVFKTYFTAVAEESLAFGNETYDALKVYYNLRDVEPMDMMKLTQILRIYGSTIHTEPAIYAGQNLTAHCDVSSFYFSKGIQWAIKYANNSLQFLRYDKSDPFYDDKYMFGRVADFNNLLVKLELGMDTVICYAPVWNSTEWVKKEIQLNVKEPSLPTMTIKIKGEDKSEIFWGLNETDKTVECQMVGGDPVPFVHWRKDNVSLEFGASNYQLTDDYQNGTSTLLIRRISQETQGEYKCTGINLLGEDQKVLKVYVKESDTGMSAIGLILVIGTGTTLLLLIPTAFLVWKLQLQKKIIDHLTGVVFRDVGK